MGKLKLLEARVLVAIKDLGVEANHVLVGTEDHIAALAKAGLVDVEEEAVKYAKSIGGKVVNAAARLASDGAEVADVVKDVIDQRSAAQAADAAGNAEQASAEAPAVAPAAAASSEASAPTTADSGEAPKA